MTEDEVRPSKRTQCKHFNGPVHNKCCKANINYRSLVGGPDFGWMARLPCIPDSPLRKQPTAKCEKFLALTPAELMAEEIEFKVRTEKTFAAIRLCQDSGKSSGEIECPRCEKQLSFRIAKSNGHVWGKCQTEGCLQWMM